MANNETNIPYAIARFNYDFDCPEYLSTNGSDWTLHPDKTQVFNTIEKAIHWMKYFGGACTVRRFPTSYERV